MAKYPDIKKAGRSKIIPFLPRESALDRHGRRLVTNLKQVDAVYKWAQSYGLEFTIQNTGHHWTFKRTGFIAEWWPSSAKMVFNKQWAKGVHVHDYEQAQREIVKRLPQMIIAEHSIAGGEGRR